MKPMKPKCVGEEAADFGWGMVKGDDRWGVGNGDGHAPPPASHPKSTRPAQKRHKTFG